MIYIRTNLCQSQTFCKSCSTICWTTSELEFRKPRNSIKGNTKTVWRQGLVPSHPSRNKILKAVTRNYEKQVSKFFGTVNFVWFLYFAPSFFPVLSHSEGDIIIWDITILKRDIINYFNSIFWTNITTFCGGTKIVHFYSQTEVLTTVCKLHSVSNVIRIFFEF